MDLVLVLETSSHPFNVVFGSGKNILFDSSDEVDFKECSDISFLVKHGLSAINKCVNDIRTIAVDIGPGGLSSVRSGVAFANGLAFGLGIPVCSFFSFELLGFEAWKKHQMPVLCTAKANEGNAYAGLYDRGRITTMRFGLLEKIVEEVTSDLCEFSVAGAHINIIYDLLHNGGVHATEVKGCRARTFIEMEYTIPFQRKSLSYPPVPINEQSAIFYE
jgi:tRNA threonylcarbamoyladenosine biosynthesis protein TsaB